MRKCAFRQAPSDVSDQSVHLLSYHSLLDEESKAYSDGQ